ncbi:MAG: ABC transporter substrate-binding protein [Candidatus Accumulibacter sp.]|jgi:iron complex transport system substrate-binding protein|nr:ABC transporter substrate-binding protein [Accumulibacter sp.]
MKKLFGLLFVVFSFFLSASPGHAGEAGRIFHAEDIPAAGVDKLWGTNPHSLFLIYVVNPERLAGWAGDLYEYEKPYIPEKYQTLPKLGGWHGGGGVPDKEMLLRYQVKNALLISESRPVSENANELLQFGMNVYWLKGGGLDASVAVLRDMGKLLGVPERGVQLAGYAQNALDETRALVKDIPQNERPRVYIAQGISGLQSTCKNEILEIAGGRSAIDCENIPGHGQQLSFERIMQADPDVLVIQNPFFVKKFKSETQWQRLRAYKNGRVHIVPFGPFSWMDKPDAVKYIALKWLACKLYPDRCRTDLHDETQKFMKLFMHLDLDDKEIGKILQEE